MFQTATNELYKLTEHVFYVISYLEVILFAAHVLSFFYFSISTNMFYSIV